MFKHAIGLSLAALLGGVVATPAQALTSSLGFSDGADDWFSEVTPGAGDTFDVEFNPFDLNFVSTSTGVFAPLLSPPVEAIESSIGSFEFVSEDGMGGFTYALISDLVFDWNSGVTVTWAAGTEFLGTFNNPDSIQFDLAHNFLASVTGVGDVTTIGTTFQFSDTAAIAGGTYNGLVDVTTAVPEPASMLGLVAIGAVAAGGALKKKATA